MVVSVRAEVNMAGFKKAILGAQNNAYFPFLYDGIRRSYFHFRKVQNQQIKAAGKTPRFGRAFAIQILDPGQRVGRKGNKPIRMRSLPANTQRGKLDDIEVAVDTLSRIAAIQEKGGTFSPRKKYFTIPIGPARTATGRTKRSYKKGGSARKNVVPIIRPGKAPFLGKKRVFKAKGRKPKITPVFLLLKKVYIKARLKMMRTWDRTAAGRDKRVDASLGKFLKDYWGK
jgi:hypothetical protein